jgi:uncharacterized protein
MRIKTQIQSCMVSIMAMILAPAILLAEQPTQVPYFAAPLGTALYTLGQGLESVSKEVQAPVRILAQESGSSNVQVLLFARRPELKATHMMSSGDVTRWMAKNGIEVYKQAYEVPMVIGNQFFTGGWLVTLNPKIRKPEDLIGKRVAIGSAAQVIFGVIPKLIIEKGWEDFADKIDISMLGHKAAAEALLDGAVDAALMGVHALPVEVEGLEKGFHVINPGSMEVFTSGKKIYHIPWTEAALKRVKEKGVPISTFKIKAGQIPDLDEDITSWIEMAHWAVYPEFPEQTAYDIASLLINHYKKFRDFHKLGYFIHPNLLTYGWTGTDFHPGALRAYKEAGLIQ